MKKTFVTTALALCTAGAASADLLLCGLEFGTSQGDQGYTLTGTAVSTVTVNKQSASLTETSIHTTGNSNGIVKVAGLSGVTFKDEFRLDVATTFSGISSMAGYPVVFSFGSDNDHCFKVSIYANNEGDPYKVDTDGYSGWAASTSTSAVDGSHTISLIMTNVNDGSGDGLLTLIVDGTVAGSETFAAGKRTASVLSNLSLGGRIGNNNNTFVGDFNSVHLYKIVPEPATATLSLLALAGLCARRRRK